ncbi:PorT family protein [Aequorivita sp. H23M31]|uniref:PorT family protein n=1 Tax=Aequorivita ciconiae TaxID=2494375 RepID=A0A410G022_9FLAO|nr:porin family protein [Aequorivita sp. H23M31]QAA80593.1 PorT family protein [Aequorivita sp. H23M31]
MKKIFYLLLLISSVAISQTKELTFGIVGGVNLSSFNNRSSSEDFKLNPGFFLGGIWAIPVKNRLEFQPEALYSLEILDVGLVEKQGNLKASYLRFPLLMKYYIIKGWGIDAGPTPGFLLNIKTKEGGVRDSFNLFDMALSLGTSYQTKNGIILGARYNLGIINISKVPELGEESKINGIQISVGYFL